MASNIKGSQQQLDATIADTIVPNLAIVSPRPDRGLLFFADILRSS